MSKPICFFDLETTGLDKVNDAIIEIAIIKIGKGLDEEFYALVNPGFPIPPESTEIHGITDEDVKDAPKFIEIVKDVYEFMNGCDLGGFNSNYFDIPFLYHKMSHYNYALDLSEARFFDAGTIFKRKEERTLSAGMKFYCGKDHEDAHSALADVKATIEVFKAQRARYEDLKGMTATELDLYCNYDNKRLDIDGKFILDDDGNYVINFGKHKGKKAVDEIGFIEWMIGKDFLPDTQKICQTIIREYYS